MLNTRYDNNAEFRQPKRCIALRLSYHEAGTVVPSSSHLEAPGPKLGVLLELSCFLAVCVSRPPEFFFNCLKSRHARFVPAYRVIPPPVPQLQFSGGCMTLRYDSGRRRNVVGSATDPCAADDCAAASNR